MTQPKLFLPKNVFLAHELFLRALHLDQQGELQKAQNEYFRAGKIFTSLIKEFPDINFFYLWSEEARLAINRINQLNASHSQSKEENRLNVSKAKTEEEHIGNN